MLSLSKPHAEPVEAWGRPGPAPGRWKLTGAKRKNTYIRQKH